MMVPSHRTAIKSTTMMPAATVKTAAVMPSVKAAMMRMAKAGIWSRTRWNCASGIVMVVMAVLMMCVTRASIRSGIRRNHAPVLVMVVMAMVMMPVMVLMRL